MKPTTITNTVIASLMTVNRLLTLAETWVPAISKAVNTIKGYAFGEKLLIGLDETIEVGPREDPIEKAGLRREAKDFSTDKLRELVETHSVRTAPSKRLRSDQ